MERKLATVRKIKEIKPIEGADLIELAIVDGWQVVVAKNVEHKVGDKIVYCEIDSFLPIREEFEFLRKSSYKKMGDQEGFRLKTIKLKNTLSQGLILPYSVLPVAQFATANDLPEGMDVSEMLGIIKYDPPIPAQLVGKVKGNFPSFLRKTDEERCLSGDTEVITEDGIKKISEICDTKYEGKVLSYNIISGENEWNNINSHSVMTNKNDWYEIELEDGTILKATGNHKIWLPDLFCYREVKDLVNDISLLKTEDFHF
jgi:RNA ligase (TIGR02306 family)